MWKQNTNTTGWDIKYYKGLGTSTREEAKEYFADIEEHRKTFIWAGTLASASVLKMLPSLEVSSHMPCPIAQFDMMTATDGACG